jgi:DNA-directed RNA polymerase specialized sigma24 family protein
MQKYRTKEVPINNIRMTQAEMVWLTEFADDLKKRVARFKDGDDICSKQVLNVMFQIKKYMERYPKPEDAAKAMSFTGRINHGRDEAIQRGAGARHERIVGGFPKGETEDGDEISFDLIDRNAVDPAMQAADRDECRRAVSQLPAVVAKGVALTSVFGFDQGEAASKIGVGRTHLSRTMKKTQGEMRRGRNEAA